MRQEEVKRNRGERAREIKETEYRQSYRGTERDRRGAERTKRERQRQREIQRDF